MPRKLPTDTAKGMAARRWAKKSPAERSIDASIAATRTWARRREAKRLAFEKAELARKSTP